MTLSVHLFLKEASWQWCTQQACNHSSLKIRVVGLLASMQMVNQNILYVTIPNHVKPHVPEKMLWNYRRHWGHLHFQNHTRGIILWRLPFWTKPTINTCFPSSQRHFYLLLLQQVTCSGSKLLMLGSRAIISGRLLSKYYYYYIVSGVGGG